MWLDDAGFFAGDFFESVSQPGLVIVTDWGDDRDDWFDGIGGIKPAAQTGLQDDQVATAFLGIREEWVSVCQDAAGNRRLSGRGLME